MNNQATLNKLDEMKLYGMARALRSALETGIQTNTPDELVAYLVDSEWDDKYNRKINRHIKAANFRYKASFEEIDFGIARNLDKNMLLRLYDSNWIKKHQNIILTGPTGVGKSFVSTALGYQACINGYKTHYLSCLKLFKYLQFTRMEGSYMKEIKNLQKFDLLILDDFGLEVFDTSGRLSLFEILEDRQGIKSTIIISQIPITKWHEIIGDPTIADAICDRIIHEAFRIELNGESIRKNITKKAKHDELECTS